MRHASVNKLSRRTSDEEDTEATDRRDMAQRKVQFHDSWLLRIIACLSVLGVTPTCCTITATEGKARQWVHGNEGRFATGPFGSSRRHSKTDCTNAHHTRYIVWHVHQLRIMSWQECMLLMIRSCQSGRLRCRSCDTRQARSPGTDVRIFVDYRSQLSGLSCGKSKMHSCHYWKFPA